MTPEADDSWPLMPTETEIYILPNGEIIVADLPTELAEQLAQLQTVKSSDPTESDPTESENVSNQHYPTHTA